MAECNRVVFYQWTHASVASSTSSTVRHGPRLKMSSDFVEADDRLGERVVVAVALGADRSDRAGLGKPLGVDDGQILGGINWSSQH